MQTFDPDSSGIYLVDSQDVLNLLASLVPHFTQTKSRKSQERSKYASVGL